MTIKEANLKIGDSFQYKGWSGIWVVESIEKRGVVVSHKGKKTLSFDKKSYYWIVIPGSHKHLAEWDKEIIKN